MDKKTLLDFHEEALKFLLAYKEKNPDFTFSIRERNNKNRLELGHWFQGNNHYVFIGFSKKVDERNKTRQVGFVIAENKKGEIVSWVEIVYLSEKNEHLKKLYKDFVTSDKHFNTTKKANLYFETKWYKGHESKDIFENLAKFIVTDLERLYAMAKKRNLLNELKVPNDVFIKNLERVNTIRIPKSHFNKLIYVEKPKPKKRKKKKDRFIGIKKDFVKDLKRNIETGSLGELLVIESEKNRLIALGKVELASKVEKKKDGEGYDVLSFQENGDEIFIEVKTTYYGVKTDFYISESEVRFSELNRDKYQLWRLFEYDTKRNSAKFYVVKGNMRQELNLESKIYTAFIK